MTGRITDPLKTCRAVLSCSVVFFATPWAVAQALLSMEFSRQEHWSGSLFPTQWISPKDANGLFPKTCECVTLHGRRDFASVIKDLEMGGRGGGAVISPYYPEGHNLITWVLKGRDVFSDVFSLSQREWLWKLRLWKKAQEDVMLLPLKMEKGAIAKECRQPLEAKINKEIDPLQESPERTQSQDNLIFIQGDPCQMTNGRN